MSPKNYFPCCIGVRRNSTLRRNTLQSPEAVKKGGNVIEFCKGIFFVVAR